MEIRKMISQDAPGIAALEKLCFSDPWNEASIASELTNKLSAWFVAVDDGKVVGYVGSQTVLDSTDMMNIAVAPDRRKQGIAQALISALESELKSRGSRMLFLEVRRSNQAAISLYSKLGFFEVGVRKNYYRNPKEDALILRKEWDV